VYHHRGLLRRSEDRPVPAPRKPATIEEYARHSA